MKDESGLEKPAVPSIGGERSREMKGGVQGKKMVITIDVKNPKDFTVTNEKGESVSPVSVDTLRRKPYNGVNYVSSAAVLGRKENPAGCRAHPPDEIRIKEKRPPP